MGLFGTWREITNTNISMKDLREYQIIEKLLKALEIIKQKKVDTLLLFRCFEIDNKYGCTHLEIYNQELYTIKLTQEEYDLLKEALK